MIHPEFIILHFHAKSLASEFRLVKPPVIFIQAKGFRNMPEFHFSFRPSKTNKLFQDIPTMNWVFMIPATLTMILCLFGVRTSKPPTPPSKSAEFDQKSLNYFTRFISNNCD